MKRTFAVIAATLLMIGFASCQQWENDNPAWQARPADTIEELNY